MNCWIPFAESVTTHIRRQSNLYSSITAGYSRQKSSPVQASTEVVPTKLSQTNVPRDCLLLGGATSYPITSMLNWFISGFLSSSFPLLLPTGELFWILPFLSPTRTCFDHLCQLCSICWSHSPHTIATLADVLIRSWSEFGWTLGMLYMLASPSIIPINFNLFSMLLGS